MVCADTRIEKGYGEKGNKRKLWKTIIIIAIIVVVLVAGFFAFRAYRFRRDTILFANGVQYGYSQAVIQLINMSMSCQPVPLYAGNTTIEVIATGCPQVQLLTQPPEQ